jgi:hypothetical protein
MKKKKAAPRAGTQKAAGGNGFRPIDQFNVNIPELEGTVNGFCKKDHRASLHRMV